MPLTDSHARAMPKTVATPFCWLNGELKPGARSAAMSESTIATAANKRSRRVGLLMFSIAVVISGCRDSYSVLPLAASGPVCEFAATPHSVTLAVPGFRWHWRHAEWERVERSTQECSPSRKTLHLANGLAVSLAGAVVTIDRPSSPRLSFELKPTAIIDIAARTEPAGLNGQLWGMDTATRLVLLTSDGTVRDMIISPSGDVASMEVIGRVSPDVVPLRIAIDYLGQAVALGRQGEVLQVRRVGSGSAGRTYVGGQHFGLPCKTECPQKSSQPALMR